MWIKTMIKMRRGKINDFLKTNGQIKLNKMWMKTIDKDEER